MTIGVARWKTLASSTIFVVEVENTRRNLKCHVVTVVNTDLSRFVATMHSGLCEQYVKSLGLATLWFDFLSCVVAIHSSKTSLNPSSVCFYLHLTSVITWWSSVLYFQYVREGFRVSVTFVELKTLFWASDLLFNWSEQWIMTKHHWPTHIYWNKGRYS